MSLTLGFGLTLADLYNLHPQGDLKKVDQAFIKFLGESNFLLWERVQQARQQRFYDKDSAELLIELAPLVEDFIGELFTIHNEVFHLQFLHNELAPLTFVKRQFVQRYAVKKYPEPNLMDGLLFHCFTTELEFAQQIIEWQGQADQYGEEIEQAAQYAAWATLSIEGKKKHKDGILFKLPKKTDQYRLIEGIDKGDDQWSFSSCDQKSRPDFNLTDFGFNRTQAYDQSHYCIYCHRQDKDSCSKGFKSKNPQEDNEKFVKNALGIPLTGCPLEQKISEMHAVKAQGFSVAALAIIMIDNPLVAATGHRICNDCSKACIFQKQEPVNTPSTETQILQDVLNLPWGFEIYSLLSRWNPLNFSDPLPKKASDKKVLIAGMGPAGFTLAHYLLNEGHTVVGIDGLKIEPLPEHWTKNFEPIYNVKELYENLDDRITGGFGGVAEYGITVRWDKNFLKLIRLILERRQNFLLKGNTRLGGTLKTDQAFKLGFDHVALCLGAGKPNLLNIENHLAPGVRQANDFLMALQLTGAAKKQSLANLQIQLPIIVIGGGLTAIDAATEALAYYSRQVEKFAERYNTLVRKWSEEIVRQDWDAADITLADEMLDHADALKSTSSSERLRWLQKWGGSTVVYRRSLQEAPSYRVNHEEVEKALEQGIIILDEAKPIKITIDNQGHANGLMVDHKGAEKFLPARTILIAVGTNPNTNLVYDEINFKLADSNGFETFQTLDEKGYPTQPEQSAKPEEVNVLTKFNDNGQSVSFFGDLHPSFTGSVVKAMASAKKGYPIVCRALERSNHFNQNSDVFLKEMDEFLNSTVSIMKRLKHELVEIVIQAPLAAQSYQPGQFYRLQNFETDTEILQNTRLAMEGVALTAAKVDKILGLISFIIKDSGASTSLCNTLKVGKRVALIGPMGSPTPILYGEKVLLIGEGVHNTALFSIGQAMRNNYCQVLYVAAYRNKQDLFKIEDIEEAADQILWCIEKESDFTPTRPQDCVFIGSVTAALKAYANGSLGNCLIQLKAIKHIQISASLALTSAIKQALFNEWKESFDVPAKAICQATAPMQCMMKGICAQCLQVQHDPVTGKENVVYSCINQAQSVDWIDLKHIQQRLSQNSLQEKLTRLWVEFVKG